MKVGITLAYSLGLLVLLALGIFLFFLRAENSQAIAHDMSIRAEPTEQLIIKDQFLILVPQIPKDFTKILDSLDLEINMPLLNWLLVSKKNQKNFPIISLDAQEALENRQVLNSLLQQPHILDAQHNFVLHAATLEWQLDSPTKNNPGALNLPEAWRITKGNSKSVIAVVDNFLTHDHVTFFDRFLDCKKRVEIFEPLPILEPLQTSSIPHGEIMLLALGACNNIEKNTTGVENQAKLIAAQRPSVGQAQSYLTALLVAGIDICGESNIACNLDKYKYKPALKPNIILLPFTNNSPDSLQFSADMIQAIINKNIIIVSAAGNNNQDASSFFPGATPGVINVGALNKQAQRAPFSNWGPSIDILAPADSIIFNYPTGQKHAQGTSIAAAYTAGTISLMLDLNPQLTREQARYFLSSSGRPLDCEAYCLSDKLCESICCEGSYDQCGAYALDIFSALTKVQNKKISTPVLALSRNYLVFMRNIANPKEVILSNQSNEEAYIEALIFDDNLEIKPKQFLLKDSQVLQISYKREPFRRTTHKIRLVAKENNKIIAWTDLYVEYVPKK